MVRHARAKTCAVRLAVKEDVKLEISDDGVGIPAERNAGVGLSSMRERADELGGSCVVESGPEGGTRVMVRLPLEAPGYGSRASGESKEPVAGAIRLQTGGSGIVEGTTEARATAHEDRDLKAET